MLALAYNVLDTVMNVLFFEKINFYFFKNVFFFHVNIDKQFKSAWYGSCCGRKQLDIRRFSCVLMSSKERRKTSKYFEKITR